MNRLQNTMSLPPRSNFYKAVLVSLTAFLTWLVNAQCPPIIDINCSSPQTVTMVGGGQWTNMGTCNNTPGSERLFSITPLVTGDFTLVTNSPAGGNITYFFKEAASGCNTNDWTCIAETFTSTTISFGPLTVGVEYFILADPGTTNLVIQTFQIECPPLPFGCIPQPISPADFDTLCPSFFTSLRWPSVPEAVAYQIFFGETSPPPFLQSVTTLTKNVETNSFNRTFYWQIRPIFPNSIAVGCPIWQFTTVDIENPVISCPSDLTVNTAPGQCAAVVNFNVTATDNCGIHFIEQVQGLPSGSLFPPGVDTIVYIAKDFSGLVDACSIRVTVIDNEPPSITCTAPVTVACASEVPPVTLPAAEDNCSVASVLHFATIIELNGCPNNITIHRLFRATDTAGNTSTCVQVIAVRDEVAPTITYNDPLLVGVPDGATIEMQCFGSDPTWVPHTFSLNSASASDNCPDNITFSFQSDLVDEGNCPVEGYINRYKNTWVATDVCGNSSSRYVFVNLVDHIPPVLQGIPENITVSCDAIPAPPTTSAITAIDECLCACTITFSSTTPTPGCQHGQVITRTWVATDACGNSTIGVQEITLIDKKGPEMSIHHPQLTGIENGSILAYNCLDGGIPEFFDALNVNSVISISTCGTSGTITFKAIRDEPRNCEFFGYLEAREFTWTGTDQCGNVSTFHLTVNLLDTEVPALLNVPDMVCNGDPLLDLVEAVDFCTDDASVRYWDVPIPNPCGTGMAKRRTYEGFDRCGNIVRDTTILLPVDDTPPLLEFTVPELINLGPGEALTINCNAGNNSMTTFDANAVRVSDDCLEGLNVRFEERVLESGGCEDQGVLAIIELRWTASDHCGNESVLTALAQVTDHAPPVIHEAAEIAIGCRDVMPDVHATDNCGEVAVTVSDQLIPSGCDYQFDVQRSITATDPCGNVSTLLQVIHVGNNGGPRIDGVTPILCDDLSIPNVTAYDICADQAVPVQMTEMHVPSPCQDGNIVQRIWTATDLCGNTNQLMQTIVLADNTPPVITFPSHSIIREYVDHRPNRVSLSNSNFMQRLDELDANSIFVTDDCGQSILPTFEYSVVHSNDCFQDGYTEIRTYSWYAMDACGNVAAISFSVDVLDDIPPVLSNVPKDTTLVCTGLPGQVLIDVWDYSSNVLQSFNQEIESTEVNGTFDVIRTWRATDLCGNESSATQHIKWIPDTQVACDIVLPANQGCNTHGVIINSDVTGGLEAITYRWEVAGIDCFIESGQGTPSIEIYIGFHAVDIGLTVTDAFGCSSFCSATLNCEDPFDDFVIVESSGSALADGTLPGQVMQAQQTDTDFAVDIWPNPAVDEINIRFESASDGEMTYVITDIAGHDVWEQQLKVMKGRNEQRVSTAGFASGGYLIRLLGKEGMVTEMVFIE